MKQYYKIYEQRFILTAILTAGFFINAIAQAPVDCAKLLKQNIDPDKPQELVSNITKNAACFALDSIDLKIWANGPVLGSILVRLASTGNSQITYADLLTNFTDAKKDTGYASTRNLIIAQTTLEATKISPESWESSKKLLKVIGMPDSEMENFHRYLLEKNGKNWNYRQLVVAYRMKQQSESVPPKQK